MAEIKKPLPPSSESRPGGSPSRELPPELQESLAVHQQWLKTGGKEGRQANLRGSDFQGLDLSGVDLRQAILENANFQGAKLLRTRLQGAALQDADLAAADNLLAPQLAGADLSDARLSESLGKFEDLANIAEASRISSHVFLVMLAACVYCWLTVATTTDAALIANTATSTLPVIATAIPLVGFYVAAPLLLLAIYLYFHLNLTRLWEGLAVMPAVFPDGRRLDQVAYPWFINGLVCAYFPRLQSRRPPFSHLQVILALALAWGVVPFTLVLLWVRFLPRHDWLVTALHLVLLALVVWFGLRSFSLARALLRGRKGRGWGPRLGAVAVTLASIFILCIVSFAAIKGNLFHYSLFQANLIEADVSLKPHNWTGRNNEEIAYVKGAILRGRNLRYAQAYRAFLVHADLSFADLRGANLTQADLYEANLQEADLSGANLSGADLQGADCASLAPTSFAPIQAQVGHTRFTGARLRGANLKASDLRSVVIDKADLSEADLFEANLESAYLYDATLFNANLKKASLKYTSFRGANLTWADFREARDLTAEQLKAAKNWPLALYDPETLQALHLPPDHNDRIIARNLSHYDLHGLDLRGFSPGGYNLQGANFQGANLQNAYLYGAKLSGANLKGADLRGAVITQEQFESAISDNTTKRPEKWQRKGRLG